VKPLIVFVLSFCGAISVAAQDAQVTDPNAKAAAPQKEVHIHSPRIKLGGRVSAAQLVNRVQPVYPPLARQTKISGTVRLHAIISKDGSVQQLEVLSGHPLLVQSALDAVRQWKYKPTLLEGEPVEVDTTIDVIYALNNDKPKPSIDPQLRADIVEMMKETHLTQTSKEAANEMFEKLRPQLFTTVKDEVLRKKIADSYLAKLTAIFDGDEFQEGVVAAYAKYFDDAEIKDLQKFYQSALGQKFNKVAGGLTADLMELGQTIAKEKLPDIFSEMCKEYPDTLGGQLPGCPVNTDKKSEAVPDGQESSAVPSSRR